LAERLVYLREMEARRAAIVGSITEQGKMTEALALVLAKAATKAELEDIYLPFKPKRRTKAMIARENGLQPLHDAILADRSADPAALATAYVIEAVPDTKAALEGARDILAEGLSESAELLGRLRSHMKQVGRLQAKVVAGKEAEGTKFSDYFAHDEPWTSVPSHRVLAMLRGQNEGVLTLDLAVDAEAARGESPSERAAAAHLAATGRGAGDVWLREAAAWAWRVKLKTSLTLDLMGEIRERAEAEAINVFARNLKDLLLAAPAGGKATMGLDPGLSVPAQERSARRAGGLGAADRHAWGQADCHRQWHRQPRDRKAGGRPSGPCHGQRKAGQGHRLRGGRLGLFGQRIGGQGVPSPRRLLARRGVDCAPLARPFGGTGKDRTEVDWRRPVSA
jgi:uncharacterized protein